MDDKITCDECGTRFVILTDAYRCPLCGTENYPEVDDEDELEMDRRWPGGE